MDGKDLAPPALIRNADDNLAVKAAWTAQSLVNRIGTIGGCDDDQIAARFEAIHQSEELCDQPLFRFARHLVTLGRNRIDFIDKDDCRRGISGRFENFAQALFTFAIARAHDFWPVDREELGIAFICHRLGKARLASARRAMQQHALGRIDAEPREQLRVTQRNFDHFAQSTDRLIHAADIIVIHTAARIARFFEFGAQLYLGILVDMDDTLGYRADNRETDLGKRIGSCRQHPAHIARHILHRLLASGGDQITRDDRAAKEVALQRLCRALQPHLALCRCEHNAGRRARLRDRDIDMFARANFGIAALQPVKPHHFERIVFLVSWHDDSGGCAFACNLDDIAFGNAQLLQSRTR